MDVICDELRKNDIDIDIETLSFHVNKMYENRVDMFHEFLSVIYIDDFPVIWERMQPYRFGHVVSFLTMVYAADVGEECKRVAVRNTIPLLRSIDISPYRDYARRRRVTIWGRFANVLRGVVYSIAYGISFVFSYIAW